MQRVAQFRKVQIGEWGGGVVVYMHLEEICFTKYTCCKILEDYFSNNRKQYLVPEMQRLKSMEPNSVTTFVLSVSPGTKPSSVIAVCK